METEKGDAEAALSSSAEYERCWLNYAWTRPVRLHRSPSAIHYNHHVGWQQWDFKDFITKLPND